MGDQTAFTERLLFSVINDASRRTFRIVVRVATGYQMLHGYPPHKYSNIGGGVGPSNFVSPLRGRRRGFCVDVTVWRCRGDEWLIIIFIHYHYHHIRLCTQLHAVQCFRAGFGAFEYCLLLFLFNHLTNPHAVPTGRRRIMNGGGGLLGRLSIGGGDKQ